MSFLTSVRLSSHNLKRFNLSYSNLTQAFSKRTISLTALRMAQNNDGIEVSKKISEVSRQEGGTTKGSTSAKMQSEYTKQLNAQNASAQGATSNGPTANGSLDRATQSQLDREANYVEAADQVGNKMASNPASVTKEDGDLLHSRETKAFGATEKGGIASQAQSLASENAGETTTTTGQATNATLTSAEQSELDRRANFAEAADKVGSKMETDPASVTKEDGDLLHSKETKAFGATEKGGIASQAQSLASANAGDTK